MYGRLAEDYRPLVAEAKALADATPFRMEIPARLRDGMGWVQVYAAPRTLPDGSKLWEGVLLDVSARRNADRKLRELAAIAAFSNDALIGSPWKASSAPGIRPPSACSAGRPRRRSAAMSE